MSTGKHEIPSAKRESKRVSHREPPVRHAHAKQGRKRSIALIVALVLIVCGLIGGTVAYLIDKTQSVVNVFEPTDVKCEVQSEYSVYSVRNTGDIDAYIRVAIVQNFVSDNHVCAECASPAAPGAGEGWTKLDDGFYYYNSKVAPGAVTKPVASLSGATGQDGCQLKIEVFASAIQADPSNVVTDVWGYTPGN